MVNINNESALILDKKNIIVLREIFKAKIKSVLYPNYIAEISASFNLLIQWRLSAYNINLKNDEIESLVNYAVLYYLHIWFENAANLKQTTNSFSKQKYALTSEQRRHKSLEDDLYADDVEVSRLNRNMVVLFENYELWDNLFHPENVNTQKNKKRQYNFIDLCFADCYSKKELNIYKEFYFRKKALKNLSIRINKSGIERGYEQYSLFLKNIINAESDREFVTKCLLFYKLEYTYRFLFAFKIASYMKENNMDLTIEVPRSLFPYYCRHTFMKQWISPFISEYDLIIPLAYENRLNSSIQEKITTCIRIISEVSNIYIAMYPQQYKNSWFDKDFKCATKFLKDKFNIQSVLSSFNIKSFNDKEDPDDVTIYDYIEKLYTKLGFVDIDALIYAHDSLKSKSKQRNKRKNKA